MFTLDGQTAIVTGGASGIGLATVEMLSKLGAKTVIADLNAEAGNTVAQALNDAGGQAVFVPADVSSSVDVDALIHQTVDTFGTLEILMISRRCAFMISAISTSISCRRQNRPPVSANRARRRPDRLLPTPLRHRAGR